MIGRALGIRPSERGAVFAAFAFLTALLSSHALLETARDALFLTHLPAGQLPFMYLGVAALSLLLARAEVELFASAVRAQKGSHKELLARA